MKKIIKKLLVYTTTSCILTSSYNVKTSSNDTIEKSKLLQHKKIQRIIK